MTIKSATPTTTSMGNNANITQVERVIQKVRETDAVGQGGIVGDVEQLAAEQRLAAQQTGAQRRPPGQTRQRRVARPPERRQRQHALGRPPFRLHFARDAHVHLQLSIDSNVG